MAARSASLRALASIYVHHHPHEPHTVAPDPDRCGPLRQVPPSGLLLPRASRSATRM